jgi:hypothetical protein
MLDCWTEDDSGLDEDEAIKLATREVRAPTAQSSATSSDRRDLRRYFLDAAVPAIPEGGGQKGSRKVSVVHIG